MPQRPINSQPLDLAVNGSPWAFKTLLRLEEMRPFCIPGFAPMPPTVEIKGLRLAIQTASDLPAGARGNLWTSVVGPNYVAMSGIPDNEFCKPFESAPPGSLTLRSGWPDMAYFDFPLMPILYRKGIDRILLAGELTGANGFSYEAFLVFITDGPTIEWPLDNLGGSVWSQPMTATASGGTYCVRNVMPPSARSGALVEVDFAGPVGSVIANASIGMRASGPNMAATPVPLLFNGAASATVGTSGVVTARAAFVPSPGSLVINHKVTGAWSYRASVPLPARGYAAEGVDGVASAVMPGTVSEVDRIYSVVEVRTI